MNKLRLTDLGKQLLNNASQGGIFIRPEKFKIGDSNAPHDSSYTDIEGNELFAGKVNFVQVHDNSMASFILTVPSYQVTEDTVIHEVAIFTNDNIMIARCVLDDPYTFYKDNTHELIAVLITTECELTQLDVTVGDYNSVPQTPFVHSLPDPVESNHNTVIVMNGVDSGDLMVPCFAIRYGAGNFQWAFTGHSRIYAGTLNVNEKRFSTDEIDIANGDTVIVSIVSGAGAGEVRRYVYNETNDVFSESENHPFSVFDNTSEVAIWRVIEGGGCCCSGGSSGGGSGGNAVILYPIHAVASDKNPQIEFEDIASSSTQLSTTENSEFIINAPANSGATVPLLPYIGQGQIGISTNEEVQQWLNGNWPNTPAPQQVSTDNGVVTVYQDQGYAYMLAPWDLGKVTFIDQAHGLPGGWDGARWPDNGDPDFDPASYEPIEINLQINGQNTRWRLMRIDFRVNATFDYRFENPGLDLSVTGTGNSTNKGYFAYPLELGTASFYNITDSVNETLNGPFTVSRTINGIEKDWYVYETQDAGFGQRRYAVTYENAGLIITAGSGENTGGNSGSGNCCCNILPDSEGIPPDWVLSVGESGHVWVPQKSGNGGVSNVLYIEPAKLKITPFNFVGDGATKRYPLGDLTIKNNNFVIAALGGITQHKTAYEIQGNEIEFAENIPSGVLIDIRVVTKEPSNGVFVDFETQIFTGDGAKTKFTLTYPIDNVEYSFVYVRSILQTTSSYTYDSATQEIVFAEAPPAGTEIEVTSLIRKNEEGYSTELVTQQLITVAPTMFLELPLSPESKDNTFLSVNGSHVHRELYSVVGNKIVMRYQIPADRDVETVIFNNVKAQGSANNNLKGVATDVMLTSKAVKLLRHNAPPVQMPIPTVELTAGRGITIEGSHPNYTIESTIAEAYTPESSFKISTLQTQENSSEIIYSWRLNLTNDVLLTVICDFAVELGPGFVPSGLEKIEYVIGMRTTSKVEPEYGRRIKGTGVAGLNSLGDGVNSIAYGNASLTQVFEIISSNVPAGYIDIVAKMRVRDANITQYESFLSINFNVIGTPKISI